jgi:predicted nuclease of predicted toxin-antitoxin system
VRVLFDQGTPVPLRQFLTRHEVATAYERGWSTLKNGELLDAAEKDDFVVLVTTDTNLQYQQNLKSRHIAIVVLSTPSWPRIQSALNEVVSAVDGATEATLTEVDIP